MALEFTQFVKSYTAHVADRKKQGIVPLPLNAEQVEAVTTALQLSDLPEVPPEFADGKSTVTALLWLLDERVPQGTYPASVVKIKWLTNVLTGSLKSPQVSPTLALTMLGHMGGGAANLPLIKTVEGGSEMAEQAGKILSTTFLVSPEDLGLIGELAEKGNKIAHNVLVAWAVAEWFACRPAWPEQETRVVMRTSGEINTDFLSPAQHASTRDDIPLHALQMLSTSPQDQDFFERLETLNTGDNSVMLAGEVVGTGSSRKSASNSLVWTIGEDIPYMPNKRRGGVVMAGKIAPIFFNTLRGCGSIPVRCDTGAIEEGATININYKKGEVRDQSGELLTTFAIEPLSILDEARAGGRNSLIIGRKLTIRARALCSEMGIEVGKAQMPLPEPAKHPDNQPFSLAQKLVGKAANLPGVLPGDYVEPTASLVFSQDTTGKMTQQEIQELACSKFPTVLIQSFCHTAAGPKSKDASMQLNVGSFVQDLGGIDLRPGDGVIHTNGNRFLLPSDVGTGGDSHTRFPIGISFPAGSDLVAFAAAQGFLPLDLPESVRVIFKGKLLTGITVRDLVHAIPWVAIKEGKLNIPEPGQSKINVFSDRILEIQGLDFLNVDESFKLTDASAERSAAGSTFQHGLSNVVDYVTSCRNFLRNIFSKRHPATVVQDVITRMDNWLANPDELVADDGALYADTIVVDLDTITEPLLAAPNDPDKTVSLSQVGGTPIDEIFIGSCMTDITDFRAAAAILEGERVRHTMKAWTVPPDRESNIVLGREGILAILLEAGANVHVPGCSLCMGNQAQIGAGTTAVSTSTRNFDNRMGVGAQVFLGSSYIAAMTAILGHIPTVDEYMDIFKSKVIGKLAAINKPLRFS